MAILDIIIRGVAIVYFKEDEFRVLFPFGNGHRVTLEVPGRSPVNFDRPGCRIKIAGATSQSVRPDFGKLNFIDITGPNAHHDGVKPVSGWENSGVLLSVPGAAFSQHSESQSRYVILPKGATTPPRVGEKVGLDGRLRLSGESFNFEITPSGPGDPLPISGGSEITFNNLCPLCPDSDEDADFGMIYQVIEDDAVKGRRFSLARRTEDLPPPPTQRELLFAEVFGFRPALRNASPYNNDPPPLVPGLPCNGLVASKSDKLA